MRSLFTRFSIWTIIVLAAVVWAASLAVLGLPVSAEYLKPFSLTVTVVSFVLAAFDRWLWRYWPIKLFIPIPNLVGDWAVELRSTYESIPGQPAEVITGTAVIKQTFSMISIRLTTGRGKSVLRAERIIVAPDGVVDIYGVYENEPDIHLRGKESEIHFGAFRYTLVDSPPTEMTGTYWTDRNTKGSVKLTRKKP